MYWVLTINIIIANLREHAIDLIINEWIGLFVTSIYKQAKLFQ